MENKMFVEIKKGEETLIAHEISRFNTNENNLSVCLSSTQMFDIPMVFNGVYTIIITLPDQVITKLCMYISYNYVVFSRTFENELGNIETGLDCSDNSLLFRMIG